MIVQLKQAWKTWPIGHVFTEMPGGVARELIRRGIAEEGEAETKAMASPANRMMQSPVNKRRTGGRG